MDALTHQVLAWVNETRKSKYPRMPELKELLKGDKEDTTCCPVANSLRYKTDDNVRVYDNSWEWNKSTTLTHSGKMKGDILPPYVQEWISEFDDDSNTYEEFETELNAVFEGDLT